ncbi:hypothetical protein K9K77_02310, partial [Candidatus Babeliales bacterium]|nr:hypothetical protein [Candidatus Babeliales bacterium]
TKCNNFISGIIMLGLPTLFIGYQWYKIFTQDKKGTSILIQEICALLEKMKLSHFIKDYITFITVDDITPYLETITKNNTSSVDKYPFTTYHKQLSDLVSEAESALWSLQRRLSWLPEKDEQYKILQSLEIELVALHSKLYGYSTSLTCHKKYVHEQIILKEEQDSHS